MDSTPVNWEALDSLIVDFAKSENLIEETTVSSPPSSSPSSSPASSSYYLRLLIRQIRRSLEVGDIDAALDLLRAHVPFVLDDHRYLFRLQKQKFIELLRRGTAKDRDSAINCLRTALAPCALDAYPINTNDLRQKRRPGSGCCLYSQWCVLCTRNEENIDHLFIHCPYSLKLWKSLWIGFGRNDQFCSSASSLLSDSCNILTNSSVRSKVCVLRKAAVLSSCWSIWRERNRRIFEDKETHWNEVWDLAVFRFTFWTSQSKEFK